MKAIKDFGPTLWAGITMSLLFIAVAIALIVGQNRTTHRPECYRMIVEDYSSQQSLINRVMADGRLTNGECEEIMDAAASRLKKDKDAETQRYLQEYRDLKAGKKLTPEDDD